VHGAHDIVLTQVSHHFELGDHRKKGLCGDEVVEAVGEPFLGWAVEAVAVDLGPRQPAIVKQHADRIMPEIPKGWRVAGDAFADPVGAGTGRAFRAHTDAAFTDPQRQPVGAGMIVVVTSPAGDISVS